MLAPPSTLLSNAMKFAHINVRSFKDVLASTSSEYMCHYSTAFRRHYESATHDQVHQKKADLVSKTAKINHIAVLRHAGYTYSKTCVTKQK